MKRLIAAMLTATTMTLAACTATAGTGPSTGADPATGAAPTTTAPTTTGPSSMESTTTGPSAPDPIESWLSATATTSTSSSTTSLSDKSTTSITDPSTPPPTTVTGDVYDAIAVTIPATVTGVGLKAAKAAIPVWRNAVRLYDESMQDPDGDWEAKIRKFVADPAAITQLSLVAAFARDGTHQTGVIHYEGEVTAASVHNVQIRACVDLSGFDVVNSDGVSISNPSTPGRFYRDFNIDFYPDAGHVWLLNLITTPKPVEPC